MQIFHAILFNIRNYSPEGINIQQRKAEDKDEQNRANFDQNTSLSYKNSATTYLTTTPSKSFYIIFVDIFF